MPYEYFGEPISVVAIFSGGGMRPVKFTWRGREYRITAVNSVWDTREGVYRVYHFSVQAGGTSVYELVFHTNSLAWELGKVYVE